MNRSGTVFDLDGRKAQKAEIEEKMSVAGFWDNPDAAQKIASQLSVVKSVIGPTEQLIRDMRDAADLFEMSVEEGDHESLAQIEKDLADIGKRCEKLELQGLLSKPDDAKNCFFSIHAGAGGTESCDWASMLLRMYTRYFQDCGFDYEELDITEGEEAGIRSITLRVRGAFAFGKLSCETGVHRLVRISPFDSAGRRHTSFVAVDVMPEYEEDDGDIELDDGDMRIDFYRAGGAGGQHVNKTSSAVRITHIPTGIVVQCQNDRSQHKNKAEALAMLKAKLYRVEQQKRDDEIAKMYSQKGEIAWGSQIRSYVMQPYQMVKDHRTGYEVGNVTAVLDGGIEGFIDAYLRVRAKKVVDKPGKQTKNS